MVQTPQSEYSSALVKGKPFQREGEPSWLAGIRKEAFEKFKAQGMPDRKQEAWKYTNLQKITGISWTATLPKKPGSETIEEVRRSGFLNTDGPRAVFIDGSYCEELSQLGNTTNFKSALLSRGLPQEEPLLQSLLGSEDNDPATAFAWINTFNFQEVLFLQAPQDTSSEETFHVLNWYSSGLNQPVFYPRLVIHIGAGARAGLKITYAGPAAKGEYFVNAVHQIDVEKNARLQLLSEVRYGEETRHLTTSRITLAEDSHLENTVFSAGGSLLRDEIQIDFKGKGAFASVRGLSILTGKSQAFHHVYVNHRVPGCTSRQLFKNIVADQSQVEFDSIVHVYRDARNSDSQQQDRNLLLSDDARAYSRPQLKIYNDDVKCNHGAATGQLEQNELFYLRSRGLDKHLARYLMTFSFAQEVLALIGPETERKVLETFVSQTLEEMVRREK